MVGKRPCMSRYFVTSIVNLDYTPAPRHVFFSCYSIQPMSSSCCTPDTRSSDRSTISGLNVFQSSFQTSTLALQVAEWASNAIVTSSNSSNITAALSNYATVASVASLSNAMSNLSSTVSSMSNAMSNLSSTVSSMSNALPDIMFASNTSMYSSNAVTLILTDIAAIKAQLGLP